jgi:hypothetical protein
VKKVAAAAVQQWQVESGRNLVVALIVVGVPNLFF